MALLDRLLDDITEADLTRLIETGARETTVIEFKRQPYGSSAKERKEFLKDISSMANTAGGDIVIGMAEARGIPSEIVPIAGDVDQHVLRLDEMARSGLEPRLPEFAPRAVPVTGGHVIVARIRRSLGGPHRVIFENSLRFWARASAGCYEPNVEQLRRMFVEGPRLAEKLQDLLRDRLIEIAADRTPIRFGAGARLAVHVAALPAFSDNRFADIVSIVGRGDFVPLPLTGNGANQCGVNFEGLVNFINTGIRQTSSYAQFLRSGVIEGVVGAPIEHDSASYFVGPMLVTRVVQAVSQYLEVLGHYEAGEPLFAQIALIDAGNCQLRCPTEFGGGYYNYGAAGIRELVLPVVQLAYAQDVASALQPAFNVLWNAFGLDRCSLYSPQGEFLGSRQRG